MNSAIIGLSLLFFIGHGLHWFFIRTKVPDILVLILMGYLSGPIFQIVHKESLGEVGALLSTVALIVILYEAGLNLSTKDLKESWLPSLILSTSTFVLTSLGLILIITPVLGFSPSLLIAFAGASTSSAIVIPIVKILNIKNKTKTILCLESAFTDIFAIILFLVILDGILKGETNFYQLFFNIGPKTFFSIFLGLFFAFSWASLKKFKPQYTQMQFSGEAWVLFGFGVASLISLNGALTVLCLGFGLSNLNLLPQESKQFLSLDPVSVEDMKLLSEITFLLKTFFFFYLGLIISLEHWPYLLIGGAVTLVLFATRYISVKLFFAKKNLPLADLLTLTAMGPRGLACAVLATLPIQKGLESGRAIEQILFAIVAFSIFLTAFFTFFFSHERSRNWFGFLFKEIQTSNSTEL